MMDSIKRLQIIRYVVEILVTLILCLELGKSETVNEQCNVENNITLVCNYIPNTLSRQYEHVRIVDFKRKYKSVVVDNSSFTDESWENVQTIEFNDQTGLTYSLTFSRECFLGLTSLKELKIHVDHVHLDTEAFVGLPTVHTLDVSKCYRLVFEDISDALKMKSTLPGVQNLIMSEIGAYKPHMAINKKVMEILLTRNIANIDISKTQIKLINLTDIPKSIKSLQTLNLSYSVIGEIWSTLVAQNDLLSLKVLDFSHTVFPSKELSLFPGKLVLANKTRKYPEHKKWDNYVVNPILLNVSGVIPQTVSVWVYNCTLIIDEPLDLRVKQLIAKKNNLKYLDVEFVCRDHKLTSIHHMDLSENELEMIHPMKCLPNLEILDLSKNEMFLMLGRKPILFEKLFASNGKLRVIKLSNNQLPNLPHNMFKYNRNIEIIDLSFNNLEQLHFDLKSLHRLRTLDIRSNMIKILDEVSITNLHELPCVNDRCSVAMTSNPILCSTCSCKSFIQWMLSSTAVNTQQQGLLCVTEDDTLVTVDKSVPKKIQAICNRKVVIIVSTLCSVVCLVAGCTIGVVFYKRKRMLQRKRNMDTVIGRFITGEEQYEFVALLSYSSDDIEFVLDRVKDPLNENFKLMIGTDRNLICSGDQYFRPGFKIHDEVDRCLNRASVVIVVVSDNFCRSSNCQYEFDQAYLQNKPIVLMMCGYVDEELMMPTLRRLYKKDVRVLWKVENGQYELTTTWENVCSSILEKVPV